MDNTNNLQLSSGQNAGKLKKWIGTEIENTYSSPLYNFILSCVFVILCGIVKIILEVVYECFL